jgi:hypothetical protein
MTHWKDPKTGLVCEARTIHLGGLSKPHWVGYVLLPAGHPWHGESDPPVEIHGGVTYASESGLEWKIGFDAAHAGDGWQDKAWAKAECEKLAAQAAAAMQGGP